MNRVKVQVGQCLLDVVIQCTGSIEGAFDMLAANPVLTDITDQPEAGTVLNTSAIINKYVADEYRNNAITPATGLAEAVTAGDGIGYWIINQDFIVQ